MLASDFDDQSISEQYPPDLQLEPVQRDIDLHVKLDEQSVSGTAGAFLLDDLTSELDETHQSRLLQALRKLNAQVFVTTIQAEAVDFTAWAPERMFHVEHGQVREVV